MSRTNSSNARAAALYKGSRNPFKHATFIMLSFWSTTFLIVVGVVIVRADDTDAVAKWPKCDLLEEYNFREDLKLEFLLKLFSHDSLEGVLASRKYVCALEGMAGLMIQEPLLCKGLSDGKGPLFRTTFSSPDGGESEKDIMDLAATTMKDAFGEKESISEFGCNYAKKNDEHEVVCVFMKLTAKPTSTQDQTSE